MMWSDMFFRLGKPQGDYDPEAILPSDAAQRLPKQLGLVYWDYCLESTDQTHKILQMHDVLEREVMFAGGIWTWNRMVVNMEKSFKTARCQLRACKQKGIRTVFVTIWEAAVQTHTTSMLRCRGCRCMRSSVIAMRCPTSIWKGCSKYALATICTRFPSCILMILRMRKKKRTAMAVSASIPPSSITTTTF